MENRIQITQVKPRVDGGRYAVKTVVDQQINFSGVLFREGHDLVAGAIGYRKVGKKLWNFIPMEAQEFDLFTGSVIFSEVGGWEYKIFGWTAHYESWVGGQRKKVDAGVPDLDVDFLQGAHILHEHIEAQKKGTVLPSIIETTAKVLADPKRSYYERIMAAESPELRKALVEFPWQSDLSQTDAFPIWCDREKAGFSTWYEFFPRSVGAHGTTSGTFKTAQTDLPRIAGMGFDVIYLPPIHPIGYTNRKGKNNSVVCSPDDAGVPWAIGNKHGGHDAVNPELGTEADFKAFVKAANKLGLEIALDFAVQCSPDHPWVTEHPEWFNHKPDGSIAFAENPPKKYEDIYPIDFGTSDYKNLRDTLTNTVLKWVGLGVRIFRVDNPHTKALPFWEYLIETVHKVDPGVLFLAEAFTRPVMMHQLGKIGFSQSYTYFTWRNYKDEIIEYMVELATQTNEFMRPNFWPNTPDILPEVLQRGQRSAFQIRWALAALLSPNAGMYSGYELLEHVPVEYGKEEYLDSEKYELKPRDYGLPNSISPFITRINEIRRQFTALQSLENIWFHGVDSDKAIVFSKTASDGSNPILAIIVLEPDILVESWIHLNMERLGAQFNQGRTVKAHDLLTGANYFWQGEHQWFRLDPYFGAPMHIFELSVE